MGYGGALTLVNGSPYNWTMNYQHSYQMDHWSWPDVLAGTAVDVYVEFGPKGNTKDDAGEAYYDIVGTSNTFSILGRKPSDYQLSISLDSLPAQKSPQGSLVNLGFRHDANVNWILSQDEFGTWRSNSGAYTDWMHQSFDSLANRTLKQICMPGSHDAGMSNFTPGTIGANFANTQTQYLDFYQQLMVGARYFDLRPVLSSGQWVSGHYSALGNGDGSVWLGGNGQSIKSIIQQVNNFTALYDELIIINISHTLDTDNDYRDLSQEQWNQLLDTLTQINNRHIISNPGTIDLSNKVLGEFIDNRAAVLVVAQIPNGIALGDYAHDGFFSGLNFPFYDSYSNTNDKAIMEADQIAKLKSNRNLVASATDRKDQFYLLSWTLSQQPEDVLNPDRAIMNLAAEVFDDLVSDAWNSFTPTCFPNVLFVDAVGIRDKSVVFPYDKPRMVPVNSDITALAIAVNNAMAGRTDYITKG